MSRHDEIKNAYKSLGGEATFYDGMITCSTLPGKAVCKLVWNIRRALKPDGILIAPTFTAAGSVFGRLKIRVMELSGFQVFHKWKPQEYLSFLKANGFTITDREVYGGALAEEGYIFVDDAYEIHLTVKGRRVAEDTYERNRIFRQILTGLGVDEKTAVKDACQMEHAVSRESYEALKRLAAEKNGGN